MIGHFWGVPPWIVARAPLYRVEEARVILMARHKSVWDLAKRYECSPEKIIMPDW